MEISNRKKFWQDFDIGGGNFMDRKFYVCTQWDKNKDQHTKIIKEFSWLMFQKATRYKNGNERGFKKGTPG